MPHDKHRECEPRASVSNPFLVCIPCNGQGTIDVGYQWRRCIMCRGSGRTRLIGDHLRFIIRVNTYDRLGKSYDFCGRCNNGYIRDVQGDGGWTSTVWLPCDDCGGDGVFLTNDPPEDDFEPFEPGGALGFYRVLLFDGSEAWGYPHQDNIHLTTPDGKYFTDKVLGPGQCLVQYAHDEFCAMTLEWADEERDAQIQQGKALARQLRGAQDASVSRVMQVSNSHTSIPKPQPIRKPRKVGRNEPCPCGSGSKHKRCCGAVRRSHP